MLNRRGRRPRRPAQEKPKTRANPRRIRTRLSICHCEPSRTTVWQSASPAFLTQRNCNLRRIRTTLSLCIVGDDALGVPRSIIFDPRQSPANPYRVPNLSGFQQPPKFSTTPSRFLAGCEDGFVCEFDYGSASGSVFGLVLVSGWSESGAVVVSVFGMQTDAFAFACAFSHRRSALSRRFSLTSA